MVAFGWANAILNQSNPELLPFFPMAKAGFQAMKAAQEFIGRSKIGNVRSFLVSGGSKRGWTTWLIAGATCDECVEIAAIAPVVPIVPNLGKNFHIQWQSYDGFTFAIRDYTGVNLTGHLDTPEFKKCEQLIDPKFYYDRLARLPKMVFVSSDDEFMQFDWT